MIILDKNHVLFSTKKIGKNLEKQYVSRVNSTDVLILAKKIESYKIEKNDGT